MSIGYDRVIETESYVSELLGTPKEKETLFQLLNNINILQVLCYIYLFFFVFEVELKSAKKKGGVVFVEKRRCGVCVCLDQIFALVYFP